MFNGNLEVELADDGRNERNLSSDRKNVEVLEGDGFTSRILPTFSTLFSRLFCAAFEGPLGTE